MSRNCVFHFIITDSHHKLIRWRLVTHGAIDGYSRLILYLHCGSNNRATTVYESFLNAVQTHHLPSRVRSDQGLENILVARHMIEKRGEDRNSMITGSSTHNQRIERLWRDMHRGVTVMYYKLFYFMEHHSLLDPLNEQHMFSLHYIYLPRIRKALNQFISSWNNHPIRTASHKSPLQIYTAGALLLQNSELEAFDFFNGIDDTYGNDPDGPLPAVEGVHVTVPQNVSISDSDMQTLKRTIDPHSPSDNYGIELYEQTLQLILFKVYPEIVCYSILHSCM